MVKRVAEIPVNPGIARKIFRDIDTDCNLSVDYTEFETFIKKEKEIANNKKYQGRERYQDREWKHRNTTLGKHRKSLQIDDDTPAYLTSTRARQHYATTTERHHKTKHRKASSPGGFMARKFFDEGEDKLLSPGAIDAAGGTSKPFGPAADPAMKNRMHAALTKLSLALRTRQHELRAIFDEADIDGSGILDEQEFMELCFSFMPGQISRAEALQLLRVVDSNKDGRVSFDEFKTAVLDTQKLVGAVTSTMKTVPKKKVFKCDEQLRVHTLIGPPLNR